MTLTLDTTQRAEDDREGLDHHLQGLPRGDLPRADHGQRRPRRGHRGQPVLHVLRLDAIHKARHEHIKLATVGNPGLHLATIVGGFPGVSAVMTRYMKHKMEELDIPPIPEFIEMIADTGAGLYACKAPSTCSA